MGGNHSGRLALRGKKQILHLVANKDTPLFPGIIINTLPRLASSKHERDLVQLNIRRFISAALSRGGNFHLVALNPVASGLAVVGNVRGGVWELIEHDKSGILVELSDERFAFYPDASTRRAAAINSLIQNPGKRQDLGRSARQRILERFSEDRLGQNLVALFRAVLQGKRQA